MRAFATKLPAQPGSPPRVATLQRRRSPVRAVQRELDVSQPGDQGEREAERAAEQVLRTGDGPAAGPAGAAGAAASSGHPLDGVTRAFFEPRFGHDFSRVRVHHDTGAAAAARSLGARAYTLDRDIVFGAGEYHPGDAAGRRLLAHELAHVVQRRGRASGEVAHLQRQAATETKKEAAEPLQFVYSAGLDPELQARFNRMVLALKAKGIKFKTINDVRPKTTAHILSTGHHIREKGAVPLGDLQALKDGKDLDGNTWFKEEWKQVSTLLGLGAPRAATDAEMLDKAKANAFELAQSKGADFVAGGHISCAYEGYEPADAHRRPNVLGVPVSSHVTGHAIDLSGIEWGKLGGEWSAEATQFVAGFGLTRPFSPDAKTYCIKEPWHFELAP